MTINANDKAVLNDHDITRTDKRQKPVYCTDNGKRWNNTIECAQELGVNPHAVRLACQGRIKTCKKLHLSYQENVTECMDKMSKRIQKLEKMTAETEQQVVVPENDIEDYLAWQKERARRKQAENERLCVIAKLEGELEISKNKEMRCIRLVEEKEAIYQRAVANLMKVQKDIAETEMELLKLKGDIKE